MKGKSTNYVLLAVLGILVLLLNTSPTLAYSNVMTKQDFVNFIGGRTINTEAMYHGVWGDSTTQNIWISPTTFVAHININSAGKDWNIGTCSVPKTYYRCVHFRDQSLDQEVSTIPADVFKKATNEISAYLK